MADTKCRRPGKGVSKADRLAAHKGKMMGKFFRNLETGTATPVIKRKK